jgi:hypothetical protein
MEFGKHSQNVRVVLRSWAEAKESVGNTLALDNDSLHLFVGGVLLLAAANLLQRPVSSWRPWLVVLVPTCFNELADLWVEQWTDMQAQQYGESLKDLLLTMLLPTLLLLTTRGLPWIYDPSAVRPPETKAS